MSEQDELGHPDAVVRLVSAVHRFGCPEIGTDVQISFMRSFKTCGSHHPTTKATISKAENARASLSSALISTKHSTSASYDAVVRAVNEYLPLINQILLSCKVQPEAALLDERLVFNWASGLEKTKRFFRSEALMFELVMTIACEAMGNAGVACDACVAGDFSVAGRNFKKAASILEFLAVDRLPKWIARGTSVTDDQLPSESTVGICEAFSMYFLAVGQQMAVATVLAKPTVPNYTLVAKLCLGIAEQLEQFTTTVRSKAGVQMGRIDPIFFTLVAFQISLQRALSSYFLSRSYWDQGEYGVALAHLNDAMVGMQTRDGPATSKGIPPLGAQLKMLNQDVTALNEHMRKLHTSWDYDNRHIYFEGVLRIIPEDKKLKKGINMMKTEAYTLEEVEPFPLGIVVADVSDDARLARELQERLNQGGW